MRKLFAWTLTWGAVAGLLIQAPRIAFAQQAPIVTVNECRALTDTDVRDRIRELASTSLKTELASIDYQALVAKYWFKADVDARIDREVDAAIEAVRADSNWLARARSTVDTSWASRYAKAVADKAYNSPGFKSAIEDLSTGVAKDAGAQIEAAAAKVSNPIIACVQTVLQSRYGGAIAQVFAQESQRNLEAKAEQPAVKIGTSELVLNNAGSISGIVLIVTRRVIGALVEGIGSRVAGVVAARIVSTVAGFIGLALIAKDLYEAGDGVFPIVAERMKSDETKTLIQTEIGKSIQTDIGQQTERISQETSERIYTVWLDFKQKYQRLLSLSEKSPAFAAFLADRRLDQLAKLGQIVDILYGTEGEDRVIARVGDGSLNKALLDLDDAGLTIATDRKSVEEALRWAAVAGKDLPRVVDYGIYRLLPPDGLTHDQLEKILSLSDKTVVERVAVLDPEARNFILNLPAEQMKKFAHRLSGSQLAAFVDYQRRLEPDAARSLLRAVAETPSLMQDVSGEGMRRAIFNSRDQLAAVSMVIRDESASMLSYGRIVKDAELVRDGAVNYRVFWERYWFSLAIAAFALLTFLSWIRRLIFGRPQVIIKEKRS